MGNQAFGQSVSEEPRTVDGVFQVIGQNVDAPSDIDDSHPTSENNAMESMADHTNDAEDSDSDDLTYNSQGKPIPRKLGRADKKQSRKTITKASRGGTKPKAAKPGEGKPAAKQSTLM